MEKQLTVQDANIFEMSYNILDGLPKIKNALLDFHKNLGNKSWSEKLCAESAMQNLLNCMQVFTKGEL